VVCPFLLLGGRDAPPMATAAAALTAALVLLAVWRSGRRLDVFLVERS
jgi:hypothetical protein